VKVRFGQSKKQNSMTSGRDVAAEFQQKKATNVKLEFTGKFNRIKIAEVLDSDASSKEVLVNDDVIEIDSDSEGIEDYYDPDLFHFEKDVTKALASKHKSQMMVCNP
jgi:DNA-binding protein YbaB